MTDRTTMEEAGFEALQRLYEVACRDTGQAGVVARFLLGLYNGQDFPFDLTALRGLDDALFEDCMAVLRMDARVASREVHTYFADGGLKFRRLAHDWGLAGQPVEDRQRAAGRGQLVLGDGDHVTVALASLGEAPGYRDIPVTLALGEQGEVKVDLNLQRDDAIALMQHVRQVNALAWRAGRRPLDAREDERAPAWLAP